MNCKRNTNEKIFFFLRIIGIIIYFSLSITSNSQAGGGAEHRNTWNKIMGVKNNEDKNHPLRNCWDTFQRTIDGKKGNLYISEIKKEFEITHDRRCGHRTYFHWGFHAKPENIKKILKKCIKKMDGLRWDELPNETKNVLLNKLKVDIAKRNRALIKAVIKATNLPRSKAGYLTGVLYDAHILLDWGDKNKRPLASPKDLLREMDSDINKMSKGPAKTYYLGKELRKKLKKACYASGSTMEMKTEEMLVVLEQKMPQLLWEKYGNKFPQKMRAIKK
jgi:hypothetical protein